jgi:hypothetical protein
VRPTVFLLEQEASGPEPGERWLTGRFSGHLEDGQGLGEAVHDLPLAEALAWARARAARVLVRYGEQPDVHFSAGREPLPGVPTWPPDDLGPLVHRRSPADRWRDRTEADPAIAWEVEVALTPPDSDALALAELVRRRDAWRAQVADLADRAGADAWDCEPLDQFIADVGHAQRRAGGAEFGWTTYGSVSLRVQLRVRASAASGARHAAAGALALPPGWRARFDPTPAAPRD